jgi:hypothetical protein
MNYRCQKPGILLKCFMFTRNIVFSKQSRSYQKEALTDVVVVFTNHGLN